MNPSNIQNQPISLYDTAYSYYNATREACKNWEPCRITAKAVIHYSPMVFKTAMYVIASPITLPIEGCKSWEPCKETVKTGIRQSISLLKEILATPENPINQKNAESPAPTVTPENKVNLESNENVAPTVTPEIKVNLESKDTFSETSETPETKVDSTAVGVFGVASAFFVKAYNKTANGISSAAGYVQKNVIVPATDFAIKNPMTVGHAGSAMGGAVMIGSAVKVIANIQNGQSVKKQLPTLVLLGAGAALTGASQMGASTLGERVALAVTSLAAGTVTGVTLGIAASHKASAVKN